MTNTLINLKIEHNNYRKKYDEWINNNSSSLAVLRLDRQYIQTFLKEIDDNNEFIVTGDEKKYCNNRNNALGQEINIISKWN